MKVNTAGRQIWFLTGQPVVRSLGSFCVSGINWFHTGSCKGKDRLCLKCPSTPAVPVSVEEDRIQFIAGHAIYHLPNRILKSWPTPSNPALKVHQPPCHRSVYNGKSGWGRSTRDFRYAPSISCTSVLRPAWRNSEVSEPICPFELTTLVGPMTAVRRLADLVQPTTTAAHPADFSERGGLAMGRECKDDWGRGFRPTGSGIVSKRDVDGTVHDL